MPASTCDLVFLANIWHELDEHAAVLLETARILKSGGSIAILDWRHDVTRPPGPPFDRRVSIAQVTAALEDAGCEIRHSGNFGMYNYLVVGNPSGLPVTLQVPRYRSGNEAGSAWTFLGFTLPAGGIYAGIDPEPPTNRNLNSTFIGTSQAHSPGSMLARRGVHIGSLVAR